MRFIIIIAALTLAACESTPDKAEMDIALQREGVAAQDKAAVIKNDEPLRWESYFETHPTPEQIKKLTQNFKIKEEEASASELLKQAQLYMQAGQLVKSESYLKLALRKDDDHPEILLALADVSLRKNDTRTSYDYISLTRKAIDALPDKDANLIFRYRYLLSLVHLRSGDTKAGHNILTDLVRIDRKFTPAYVALSQSYLAAQKSDLAIFIATRGIDRGKDTASLQNALAQGFRQKAEFAQAKTHFQKALALEPNHVPSMLNFSKLLMETGNKEAAEIMLKRAAQIAPGDFATYQLLAQSQVTLGQYALAKNSFERALELNPEDSATRFQLAKLLHERLKQRATALKLFNEVVQLNDQRFAPMAQNYVDDILAKGL